MLFQLLFCCLLALQFISAADQQPAMAQGGSANGTQPAGQSKSAAGTQQAAQKGGPVGREGGGPSFLFLFWRYVRVLINFDDNRCISSRLIKFRVLASTATGELFFFPVYASQMMNSRDSAECQRTEEEKKKMRKKTEEKGALELELGKIKAARKCIKFFKMLLNE
jgi:hypothetical protein